MQSHKEFSLYSLDDLLRLERRPVKVSPDAIYSEIGIYSFGRGIFHKQPRTGLEVGNKDLFLIKEGDFILQITFAWEGAVALASSAEEDMYGSVRFPTFRIDESLCYPPYLVNYFRTVEGREQLVRISPGSAGRNRVLSLKRIPEILVPLPCISEQRRVVTHVEELSAKIDEARGLRREADLLRESLCRSILFHDSTERPLMTPMSELVRLKKLDVDVRSNEFYTFAGVYSFGKGVFKGRRKSGMEFAYTRLSRLQRGNFIFPKLMAWEGAFGVVPPECDGLFVSPEFPVFEINESRVLPETLDVYFRTPSVWPVVAGISTGTNVRRRRLQPSSFLTFEMPLPSMSTQQLLRKVRTNIDSLKNLQKDTSDELDALLPSVLYKAFRGEL